jgi:hypothetical protein
MPMRLRSRRKAPRSMRQGLVPSTVSEPDEGLTAVAIIRSNVVLPAPDGPMIATHSPLAISQLTALIAQFPLSWTSVARSSLMLT